MKTPLLVLLLVCLLGKNAAFCQDADSLKVTGLVHEGTGTNLLGNGIFMAINLSTGTTSISKVTNGLIDADSLFQGGYYLYAVPNPFVSTNYFPTYFVNKIDPNQAAYIPMTGSVSDLDIYLVAKTVSETGTATLNGRFYYFDGSSDAGTDFSKKWFNTPVPPTTISISGNSCNTLPVLLYNSQNQIVAWTVTDTEGYFQFKNLAGGDYYARGQRYEYQNYNNGYVNIPYASTKESTFRLFKSIATDLENIELVPNELKAYPNPLQNQFQLSFEGEVSIADVSGNIVYEQEHHAEIPIDASTWPKGVYFLKAGNTVQKLIKH